MKRFVQDGMCKKEDLPSAWNINETKRSLGLALKADLANGLDIISKMFTELLDGIEQFFDDPVAMNGDESKAMDLILGGKLILKFFTDLPNTDEGVVRLVEDLRLWEVSAPIIKKDKLNALIKALKGLEEPVSAGQVIQLVANGLPTRMDPLIQHLSDITVKELGDLQIITIAPWSKSSSKSILETEISDTTLANPAPVRTSSEMEPGPSRRESNVRLTLDKLKDKLKTASSALTRP